MRAYRRISIFLGRMNSTGRPKEEEMRRLALGSILALALALTPAAMADIFAFEAVMSGANEVPPNASPGFGTVFLTFDSSTSVLTILPTSNYNDLLANVTASHIHRAPAGINGPIIIPLAHTGGTDGFLSGSGVLSAADVVNLFNGGLYANVHSSLFPGGEIRGQLVLVPTPGALALVGVATLLGPRRRRR
jgi:hypothetical protein